MIGGSTAVFGLIGKRVEYSLSPLIHNTLAALTGVDSVYAGFPVVEPSMLECAIKGAHAIQIKGLNITIPYKKSVMPFLCGVDANAGRMGVANTLKYTENGYFGYNTDVTGVIKALEKNRVELKCGSVLILGAGGGALAAAFAAAEVGAKRLYIANRTNNNSELLASMVKKYYNELEIFVIAYSGIPRIRGGYFIFQTTSVGMEDSSVSPLEDDGCVSNATGVFDIIYTPPKTKILRDAEMFGKQCINGLDMLIYQAVAAFEIWNGIKVNDSCVAALSETVVDSLNPKPKEGA